MRFQRAQVPAEKVDRPVAERAFKAGVDAARMPVLPDLVGGEQAVVPRTFARLRQGCPSAAALADEAVADKADAPREREGG